MNQDLNYESFSNKEESFDSYDKSNDVSDSSAKQTFDALIEEITLNISNATGNSMATVSEQLKKFLNRLLALCDPISNEPFVGFRQVCAAYNGSMSQSTVQRTLNDYGKTYLSATGLVQYIPGNGHLQPTYASIRTIKFLHIWEELRPFCGNMHTGNTIAKRFLTAIAEYIGGDSDAMQNPEADDLSTFSMEQTISLITQAMAPLFKAQNEAIYENQKKLWESMQNLQTQMNSLTDEQKTKEAESVAIQEMEAQLQKGKEAMEQLQKANEELEKKNEELQQELAKKKRGIFSIFSK